MVRAVLLAATLAAAAQALTPTELIDAAPAADWIEIAPDDLLVMDLAPDARGRPRRVLIQLIPAPFGAGHTANIRALARAHWWDGTSVNRVQDNYVVQWGDATEKKPLPRGLTTVAESAYTVPASAVAALRPAWPWPDAYARHVGFDRGWPVASNGQAAWPVHCYGMVGVGRNLSPDAGSGAELYVAIGHAPRGLDRNIAVVGRVVQGIEHLAALPRGAGPLGFYEDPAERVPIASVRVASELSAADRPRLQSLSTSSDSFARLVPLRAARRDDFFIRPAGGIDLCNAMPPVRVAKD